MPIEKVNVYVGYSCPIMGIDSFGMHTINVLLGATKYHSTWVLYATNYYIIVALPQIIQSY